MSYHEIYNVETGELTRVDLTPEEIAQREAAQVKADAEAAERQIALAARQAIFDRLGLTAEEAAVLGL